jgi:ketosteroid isomerase-like protein
VVTTDDAERELTGHIAELADRLIAAIEAGDTDAVRACYAPGARIWHNFDQAEQDVDANVRTLQWMVGRLSDRRYEIVRRVALPDGYLQEHVLRGTTRSGATLEMPACLVVTVEGGRIAVLREYLDTAQAAVLTA